MDGDGICPKEKNRRGTAARKAGGRCGMKPSQPGPQRQHTLWSYVFMLIATVLFVCGVFGDNFWVQMVLLLFCALFLMAGLYAADQER